MLLLLCIEVFALVVAWEFLYVKKTVCVENFVGFCMVPFIQNQYYFLIDFPVCLQKETAAAFTLRF